MDTLILDNESLIRGAVFLVILILMAGAEALFPRRPRRQPRGFRWPINLAFVALGLIAMRVLVPVMAVGAAIWAASADVGLLAMLDLPFWAAAGLTVAAMDLAVYAQHVAFHRVPVLWRLHRVHHTDLDLDATSGLRFHPGEYVVSMLFKAAVVVALGAPAAAVILFEVVLNGMALFNHANLRLPGALDRGLRMLVVTPDMHVVHHSIDPTETDRNFGFNLSFWDRLFGTYKARPDAGAAGLTLGLKARQDPKGLGLGALLVMPFNRRAAGTGSPAAPPRQRTTRS